MKNLKTGTKIFLGFACIFVLLLAIALTSASTSLRTGSNINEVNIYSGLENSANSLMHILNETRISAEVLYKTNSFDTYEDLSKQIMYCDVRLEKLYEYIDTYPQLSQFKASVDAFNTSYQEWHNMFDSIETRYTLNQSISMEERQELKILYAKMHTTCLLAHESLSNTVLSISEVMSAKTNETIEYNVIALVITISISAISLFTAVIIAFNLMRSITKPIGYMRDALVQIGQSGNLKLSPALRKNLAAVASGKDEMAECTTDLCGLIERLETIDKTLFHVANGDLTVHVSLQSADDTMGLAVQRMLNNLNQKFMTIVQSIQQVNQKAAELSEGSQLLSSGSQTQAQSVGQLSDSVVQIGQKSETNTLLAQQATALVEHISENATIGTQKMNQMIQAVNDINTASQSIGKVIKMIDDIAFQTNILALNAAVEAARAGQHGKGFAVVAEEVRNLATRSAEAARDTSALIDNTIQKSALGANIAADTSKSLEDIVQGVVQSNSIIGDMSAVSQDQAADIKHVISYVKHVEQIVEQNSTIASQSANAAGEISGQSNLLHSLVAQFKLLNIKQFPTERSKSA